jgi:hypothetical protein
MPRIPFSLDPDYSTAESSRFQAPKKSARQNKRGKQTRSVRPALFAFGMLALTVWALHTARLI